MVATFVGLRAGFSWKEIETGMLNGIINSLQAIVILGIIGILIGAWILSGVVPTLLYYGLKVLNPKFIVASKPGTTGEEAVLAKIPDCTYQPYNTEMEGATAVLEGKADAFVYDLPFNAIFMAMHGPDKIVFLDKPFTVEPVAWAIRKNDPDFLDWLNTFLAKIKQDGRFEKIHAKWFKNTEWFKHVRWHRGEPDV